MISVKKTCIGSTLRNFLIGWQPITVRKFAHFHRERGTVDEVLIVSPEPRKGGKYVPSKSHTGLRR
jgi:hypothetical protein